MNGPARALAVSVLAAGIASVPVASNAAEPGACVVAEDAATAHTELGRTISVLHPHGGRIYYGYGDYTENSGSYDAGVGAAPPGTNISYLNPKTGKIHVAVKAFRTEAILNYRTINGDLYVPNIDPSAGASLDNAYATNAGGRWRAVEATGATAAHIYDVAKVGRATFIAGSNQPLRVPDDKAQFRGVIFRSDNNGQSFREVLRATPKKVSERTGFERFYWVAPIGKKVYARASIAGASPIRVLDTTKPGNVWREAQIKGVNNAFFGISTGSGREITSWRGLLVDEHNPTGPAWYDGYRTQQIDGLTPRSKIAVDPQDKLYAMSAEGVVLKVSGGKEVKVSTERVRSAIALAPSVFDISWKQVSKLLKSSGSLRPGNTISTRAAFTTREVARVDPGSTAFAVAGGRVFFSPPNGASQICSVPVSKRR